MRLIIISFLVIISSLGFAKAQTKTTSVGITLGAGVLHSFNPELKEGFGSAGYFAPTLALYITNPASFFIEVSEYRPDWDVVPGPNSVRFSQFSASFGLFNDIYFGEEKRLAFRQKFGPTLSISKADNLPIENKIRLGFTGGLGLQTRVNKNLYIYLDANYLHVADNLGGIKIEPGIIVGF